MTFWVGYEITYSRLCVFFLHLSNITRQSTGLLQPLSIPHQAWSSISLDFVEGLPTSYGKNVLLVVVDCFSKYTHLVAHLVLYHIHILQLQWLIFFLNHIFKSNGLPYSIVSNLDVAFTSITWKKLFRISGTKLSFGSAYHPQSEGQLKRGK